MMTRIYGLITALVCLFLVACVSIRPAIDNDPDTWQIDNVNIHHFEKGEGEASHFPFTENSG